MTHEKKLLTGTKKTWKRATRLILIHVSQVESISGQCLNSTSTPQSSQKLRSAFESWILHSCTPHRPPMEINENLLMETHFVAKDLNWGW